MKRAAIVLALGVVLSTRMVWADCGSIPFKSWVSIFEPNQRAVIAYDGREEILLLSTDLRASEPTKVLEVIPFPTEPEVSEGDIGVFHAATELINRKLFPAKKWGGGGGMGGMGGGMLSGAAPPPAGEVTFHEKIGAHDVNVIRVVDARRFVGWVEDYLKNAGVDNPSIPGPLKQVIGEYLDDGFQWFAFNVVELGSETVTKEAVQYRFGTRFLYYPLRITRAEKGNTVVRLLVLSPRLVQMPNSPALRVRLVHRPVSITRSELRSLDEDLYHLLKNHSTLKLRTWEIKGPLSAFRRDVITR